jgi:hypothetical protein
MNAEFESGPWRNTSPDFPTDHFNEAGVFAYYDAEGCLEAMEFHEPAQLVLRGVDLLGLPYSELMPFLSNIDPVFDTDGSGASFRTLEVGVYAPNAVSIEDYEDDEDYEMDGSEDRVEAVLIGRPGYYDFLDELT